MVLLRRPSCNFIYMLILNSRISGNNVTPVDTSDARHVQLSEHFIENVVAGVSNEFRLFTEKYIRNVI